MLVVDPFSGEEVERIQAHEEAVSSIDMGGNGTIWTGSLGCEVGCWFVDDFGLMSSCHIS